ncbi:MAG: hypothetical protein HC874_09510 [Richelia sp. SL_2_1]|nr:hypothetical protein [Richelia sp. SM1_7_0]NJN08642.1 hypothetical protein [Richelia sp. RM1_1_1]NJO27741.1 hypothetical protein [Richelia sp. SL_2_1]
MSIQKKPYRTKRSVVIKFYLLMLFNTFILFLSFIGKEPLVAYLQDFNIKISPFLLPIVIGLFSPLPSWLFVKESIEESIECESKAKIEDNREKCESEIKKIKEEYERKAPEIIKEKQELEFLAIWTDKEQLNHVDFNEMSEKLRHELMKDRKEFQEIYLESFRKRYEARQDIINKLNDDLLKSITRTAGDYSFREKQNDFITKEENQIYKNIYAILRAWLICSIKFDCEMPTEHLHRIINKNSKRELDALKYIRDNILLDDEFKEILTNDKSREIISDYISRFCQKIDINA